MVYRGLGDVFLSQVRTWMIIFAICVSLFTGAAIVFSESDVSSYDILFDPAVKGRVALFDWFLPNMGCLSKYNGNKNPYDLNASEFSALGDTLMKLRPQVGLVGNTSQVIQAMAGGSYDLAIAGEWVQADV